MECHINSCFVHIQYYIGLVGNLQKPSLWTNSRQARRNYLVEHNALGTITKLVEARAGVFVVREEPLRRGMLRRLPGSKRGGVDGRWASGCYSSFASPQHLSYRCRLRRNDWYHRLHISRRACLRVMPISIWNMAYPSVIAAASELPNMQALEHGDTIRKQHALLLVSF